MLLLPSLVFASSDNQVDLLAKTFMQQNKVPGLSIAVINGNHISTYNYGYANELTHNKTSDKTIYRVASFSKTYTATLAAIAATEGKLNLNSAFNVYIPELKNSQNLNKITTIMLLAHVSSLPFDFTPTPKTYLEVIQDLNQFVPPVTPGSQYGYSNAGIGTVGYILQNVYATNYEQILAEKISQPLNLTSTYLNLPEAKEQYVAIGHEKNNKIRPYDRDLDIWFAAASIKSSITDMAKFLNAQINPTTLNNVTLSKAIANVHQNRYCLIGRVTCEQLSWQTHMLTELNNSTSDSFSNRDHMGNLYFAKQKIIANENFPKNKIFIDKTCGGYGMSGYMVYIPEKKLGVVILLNKLVGDERVKLGRDILQSFN